MSGVDVPGVLYRRDPAAAPLPLVFDSPHSGVVYPADFRHAAPLALLRTAEDTHVDALYAAAPAHGAVLLAAHFPRSYIDVNRAADDIDPALLAEPWPGDVPPGRLSPGEKTKLGIGLIRRLAVPGTPVYDRHLSAAEIRARIDTYYQPYHDALAAIVDALHARFGAVWHVNCHSMAARGSDMTPDGAVERADFVLGDRDGTSCDATFTELVAQALRAQGHAVAINDPYTGAELVRRHGDPQRRRHSLQIEINRRLYMDEATRERSAGFARLQADLTVLIAEIAGHVRTVVA
jgi:N-formylglutamate amidohydrolase